MAGLTQLRNPATVGAMKPEPYKLRVKAGRYVRLVPPEDGVNPTRNEVVDACEAGGAMRLMGGREVKRGDIIVRRRGDDIQSAVVMTADDFHRQYIEAPERPAASSTLKHIICGASATEHAAAKTLFRLEPLLREPRCVERAWVDVQVGLTVLVNRARELQKLQGASKETSEATARMREALGWLRERPTISPIPVDEVAAAAKGKL